VRVFFAVAVAFGSERSQVDQAADVRDVDASAPGDVLDRELHRRPLRPHHDAGRLSRPQVKALPRVSRPKFRASSRVHLRTWQFVPLPLIVMRRQRRVATGTGGVEYPCREDP
jgi:hypothetical protein